MDYVRQHKKVKKAVENFYTETGTSCVDVGNLAKSVKCDPRTVRRHLEILEADGLGKFHDPRKKIFCLRSEE